MNDAVRHSVEAQLELKEPQNIEGSKSTDNLRTSGGVLLNPKQGVVSVLADLGGSWIFYWLGETNGSGVALHKLKLEGVEGAAGLAKYILESLNDESRRESLPTTFVDRLSFEAFMEKVTEDHDHKRARRDAGAGSSGSSSQTQDGKPAGSEHQPSPSGPGDSSRYPEIQENGAAGDGNRTMDMARGLRLFAPHSNRDVANELDLLYMVDEAEQYIIIRSFPAKKLSLIRRDRL